MTKDERMEDYFELRSWGEDRESAALRLRLTMRTAERYEREMRQRQEGAARTMTTTTQAPACLCGCGRALAPRATNPYAEPCRRRWAGQGRPEGGPRPPQAARGEVRVTRLAQVEALFAEGLTYADAAESLGIAFGSVEHYAAELIKRRRERAAALAGTLRPAVPLPAPRHWSGRAACRGQGDLFFGPEGERVADRQARETAAVSLCEFCPVRGECLAEGLGHKFGTWGGMTEDERAAQRREARQRREEAA